MKKKKLKYQDVTYKIEKEENKTEIKNKQDYNVELTLKFKANKRNKGIPVIYIAGVAILLLIIILIIR